jgi:UDP-N-acetylmuramoyl-tripeptide--D-alanyl-D-alanine ligase
MDLRASQAAAAVSGRLIGPDRVIRNVVVDSREARAGSAFFALPGTRTNGHRFLEDAWARGASVVVGSRYPPEAPWHRSCIVVEDPGSALLALARAHRRSLTATVIGITGSVGKTTAKDFTAAVLAGSFRVASSPRSFNNEIGVPLTVCGADRGTEVLVAELGAGAVGEIAALCELVRPHLGVVTAVGPAHLETFGSLERIAEAKAELVEALPTDGGVAVLNADDPAVASFAGRTTARVLSYGRSGSASVGCEDERLDERGRARFTAVHEGARARVEMPVVGAHIVVPALAAIACGIALGVPLGRAAELIGTAQTSPGRMEELSTPDGVRILHDAYNANPMSMLAGLRAAAAARGPFRSIAVLGAMEQLGADALPEHERVGRVAAELGFDALVAVGERARSIADGAIHAGMSRPRVVVCAEHREAVAAVRRTARPGDVVLVKASRAARLERLVDELCRP